MKIVKNYFITLAKSTLVVVLTAATFASCSKDSGDGPAVPPPVVPPPTVSPIIGYWVGTYNTTGVFGTSNYAMLIKPGAVVRVYDLDDKTDTTSLSVHAKTDGVWTLNGTTLQTSYKSGTKTVNTTATVNAAYSNMTGTWAFDGAVKGNITLNKQ
jgi:hypothetical protein